MQGISENDRVEETRTSPKEPKEGAKPSRTLLNFWVDAILFLSLVFLVWVSVMMQIIFPPPTQADGWTLLGWSYNQWHYAKFGSLCVCTLLALEHLVLHWNWVCTVLATRVLRLKRPDEGVQAIYGVGTFIAILVTFMGSILVAMILAKAPPS